VVKSVVLPVADRPTRTQQLCVGDLAVQVISPAPRALWLELLRCDAEALPSQTPLWLDGLCALKGYRDASRFYRFADGQQLVLPLVQRSSLGVWSPQASLPHAWGVGGVVAARTPLPQHLLAVFEDLKTSSALSTNVLPNPRQGPLWAAARPPSVRSIPRCAHVLDLEGGFDRVWRERFSKTTRRMVRKAEKLGVRVECDTTGRLASVVYHLRRAAVARWAARQHEPRWLAHLRAELRDPRSKIEHIARVMGGALRIWVAWRSGVPIAASMVLLGANADDIMGVMDAPKAAATGANDLLLRHSIEDACNAGCRLYHLGESGFSEGLARFKERFGAQAYPYEEFYVERLPLSRVDRSLRGVVKHVIGFRDV
jgi:hypothetical protein